MISLLISVLVVLLIAGVLYWAIHRVAATFGIPPQIIVVLDVLIVLLVVFYLVRTLLPGSIPR